MYNYIIILLLSIPGIIIATTLHEFTRAAVSTALGDKKPKNQGKLTLNPVKHFEPIGFLLMLMTGFGWGKPVETSALYYNDRKFGNLVTAIVPTVVNIVVAFIAIIISKRMAASNVYVFLLITAIVRYNISIAVYNLVPITPMDCTKVLSVVLPSNQYFKYMQYEKIIQMVFLLLLFMGYTNFIFQPIIAGLTNILYFIAF